MDFYSAETARAHTKKSSEIINENDLKKIKDKILKAINEGRYHTSICLDCALDQRILDEFKELGYKVTPSFAFNNVCYVFSWK